MTGIYPGRANAFRLLSSSGPTPLPAFPRARRACGIGQKDTARAVHDVAMSHPSEKDTLAGSRLETAVTRAA